MSELENARRTIAKAEDVLDKCRQYFDHQAAMNATAHLSTNVIHPPLHSAIVGVLSGILLFKSTYANLDPVIGTRFEDVP